MLVNLWIPQSFLSSSLSFSVFFFSFFFQFWICQLPNLKLLTDYIINITAVHSGRSSSHLTSFMLEDIGEKWNYTECGQTSLSFITQFPFLSKQTNKKTIKKKSVLCVQWNQILPLMSGFPLLTTESCWLSGLLHLLGPTSQYSP